MKIAITSQNLDPKIVVSGISTVVNTIITHSTHQHYLYEVGYRDGDKKDLKWFFKQFGVLFKFHNFLKKNRIALVHINLPMNPMGIVRDYLLFLITRIQNKKVILHIHGGRLLMIPAKNLLLRKIIKYLLNYSDKVVVLSAIEKEILLTNYGFANADFLENAVDTSTIAFWPFSDAEDGRVVKPTILYLARIIESKGIDDVIVALKELSTLNKFRFILCGSGDNAVEVAAQFRTFLPEDDFEFRGAVAGKEKWDIIYRADIFLLPSRHSEGLPMSLLETMAAGKVPVVTDEASMIKVVKNGHNGLVVKKYDGKSIALKINELIENPTSMVKYSYAARDTIVNDYDVKTFIKKLDGIYSSLK